MSMVAGAPNLKWSSRGRRWEVRAQDLAEGNQEKGTKSGFGGEIPADLKERISALHALCILKSREGNPPPETGDVPDTEEENLGLEFP